MITPQVLMIAGAALALGLIGLIVWLVIDWLKERKRAKKPKAAPPAAEPPQRSPARPFLLTTEKMAKGNIIVFRCNYVVTQGNSTRDICPFEVIYKIKADATVDIEVPEPMLAHMGKHVR